MKSKFLSCSEFYKKGKEFANLILQMLRRNDRSKDYNDFMIRQLTPIYEDLGFDNKNLDTLQDQLLRMEVIKAMCKLEHKVSFTPVVLNLW